MAIQGLRSTADFVADQRPKNWREAIFMYGVNGNAPLTALMALMKSQSTDDPEFNWWQKAQQTRRVALNANLTTSNTNITVASGARGFIAGQVLYVEHTREIMRVVQNPTSDTVLVVERGLAGTTPTAVTYNGAGVNPNLVCIGSAFEEGSLAPAGVQFDPTKYFNYTQIFRSTYEQTRTAQKTRLRTGDAIKEAKRECLENFQIDAERALWFGQRAETTVNGKPMRLTGGILSFIDSGNVADANSDFGSGVTMEGLEGYLERIFKYGSNEKIAFLGNRAFTTLNQIARKNSTIQVTGMQKEYGVMNVARFVTGYGTLVLRTHPLFNQMSGGTTGGTAYHGMESNMVVLDAANLKYRYIDDIKSEGDLQAVGQDGTKAGFIGEFGLEVNGPQNHFWLKNLVKAARDA